MECGYDLSIYERGKYLRARTGSGVDRIRLRLSNLTTNSHGGLALLSNVSKRLTFNVNVQRLHFQHIHTGLEVLVWLLDFD